MKFSKATQYLLLIFLCSMVAQMTLIFIGYIQGKIYPENLGEMLVSVLKIYSIHLSILGIGTFFNVFADSAKKVSSSAFFIATILSLIWNLLLAVSMYILLFVKPPETYHIIIDFEERIADISAFLITGVLAYFLLSKSEHA